jgi:hypothetical protein
MILTGGKPKVTTPYATSKHNKLLISSQAVVKALEVIRKQNKLQTRGRGGGENHKNNPCSDQITIDYLQSKGEM